MLSKPVSLKEVYSGHYMNVYFNDILQLIPEARTYADDCTLTFTCERSDRHKNSHSYQPGTAEASPPGARKWQVTFAPDKTQAVLISRRQDAVNWDQTRHFPGREKNNLQESVNILGGGV
ncbi:hypothetical protein GWK47_023840 [Chionoecetes opilio]|uniref:Uncharacterized protein n=1 Tax=Chionoecetes opilio TaxID=41210 RepID=A0A8J4XM57_CHIOP|nr:hypothetical protein GWK47_023840 [Chionoecetes opilio]